MKRADLFLLLSISFCMITGWFYLVPNPNQELASQECTVDPQCRQTDDAGSSSQPQPQNRVIVPELDFDGHVAKLKETVGGEFAIVVEKPFVVIGDQSKDEVNQWASGTIRWAVSQIKESYFEKDPDHIINIWLFKDKKSYDINAKRLFGRTPTTPYGYYSPSDKALVMNISTGGGTLVHEIVHPFMAANFPECPSWFNEGLASLYEQSSERNKKIVGLTNWRLRGLQFAIHDELLGTFEKLMSTNGREFYEGDSTNYAQARYLCYWLQEKGVLRDYYHRFVKNAVKDPTGIATLKEVLGTDDLDAFQTAWEKDVLKLRFP